MNENGWICLWRKIVEWQWWSANSDILKVFLYLLCKANTKDKKWRNIEVKRGQIVTSRQHLSLGTYLSERTVRTCLAHLQESGDIEIKTTNKYSIITICNYGTYQDIPDQTDQQTDQQTASKPTTTKQLTINNNNNSLSPTRARETEKKFFEGNPTPQPTALATATEEKEKSSAQKEKDFTPPTERQVKDFCQMHGLIHVNPVGFVAYYVAVGWTINGRPMRNWQAAAVNWNEREKQRIYQQKTSSNGNSNNGQTRQPRHASIEPSRDARPEDF